MDARATLTAIYEAAVAAVDPAAAIRRNVQVARGRLLCGRVDHDLTSGRVVVLAFGKAAAAMVSGLVDVIGDTAAIEGLIATDPDPGDAPLPVFAAGHPLPTEASVAAGRRALELAAGAGEADLVVILVSGGGSAMLCLPALGLGLAELRSTNEVLSACGVDIGGQNTVRKHLSAVKGGRIAVAAGDADLLTLAVSDVVGDALDVIASGPTIRDPSSFADALAVVDRYSLRDRLPGSVVDHLQAGAAGRIPDSPDVAHPRHEARVIAGGGDAAEAAAAAARTMDLTAEVVTTALTGEARDEGRRAASRPGPPRSVRIRVGETTVTVRGGGCGGRNQEAALAGAIAIEGTPITFLAAGTDGIDGPTDAAGAVVDGGTVLRAHARGLDPEVHLDCNDSNTLLSATGDLLVTGPSGTNVGDIWLVLSP